MKFAEFTHTHIPSHPIQHLAKGAIGKRKENIKGNKKKDDNRYDWIT